MHGMTTFVTKQNCFRFFVASGELAEPPRPRLALANLVGTAPEDVRVGMPIQIAYQEIPGEEIRGRGSGQARQSTQTICRHPVPSGAVTGTYPNLIRCVVPGTFRQDGQSPSCVPPWLSTQVTLPTPSNPYV